MPLMILFVPNTSYTSFEDIQIQFMGVDIAIGDIIINLINLLVGFFISYAFVTHFLYRYLQ
jgi:hypothetical protein